MIHLGVVVVQECGFAVADVKVARWFRWESGDNFAINGSLKDACVGGILLLEVEGR